MPNKSQRNKTDSSRFRRRKTRPKRPADSVKALLNRPDPALARLSQQAARHALWRRWLETNLPAELVKHVSGVVERGDTLVIFAESAAWSTRMRYVVTDLDARVRRERPEIRRVAVRVLPNSA